MGYFKYKYHCLSCGEDKYSYVGEIPYCAYCGSRDITVEDIKDLRIEKFSEEGLRLTEKENELYTKPKEGK